MIRFRVPAGIDGPAAVQCQHPALARLAGCGPWRTVGLPDGGLAIEPASAPSPSAWGPWQVGLGGLSYQLADPLPPCVVEQWSSPHDLAVPVALRCGITVPVAPAIVDGFTIALDGTLGSPASAYGRAVLALTDRIISGEAVMASHQDSIAVARMALRSCLRIPEELLHAWCMLSTGDVPRLIEAASSFPKDPAGAGGSSAGAPVSTPPG